MGAGRVHGEARRTVGHRELEALRTGQIEDAEGVRTAVEKSIVVEPVGRGERPERIVEIDHLFAADERQPLVADV